jgi:putative toxin-antitoxin system antitoxin component (TIGR02293 family)
MDVLIASPLPKPADFVAMVLSDKISDGVAVTRAVHAGLEMGFVRDLVRLGALEEGLLLESGLVPKRTWAHGISQGAVSAATARKLLRFLRVYGRAKATFGDKASLWLLRSNAALDDARPIDLVEADHGVRAVETLLGRIDHGIAA